MCGEYLFNLPQLASFVCADNRSDIRSRGDREMDNQHILQTEEKDVVSSVATVLSDLCGPGEWMPMAKLHTEVCYGKNIYTVSMLKPKYNLLPLISPNCLL